MKKLFVYSFFLLLASPAAAAPMMRVVSAPDSHTLVLERGGVQSTVRLAGVELPPDAESEARELLAREVVGRWVMVEMTPGGTAYVYRSPDAMEVNRAVISIWANGGSMHAATFLGWASPGPRARATAAPRTARTTRAAAPRAQRQPHVRVRRRDNRH